MSELVPYEAQEIATNGQLDALVELAETTQDPQEAHEIMVKGRLATELLRAAKRPFEEAHKAGKASTLAARKLGLIIANADSYRPKIPGFRSGFAPSERGLLLKELGVDHATASRLRKLSAIPDPAFQRYIQSRDKIPSIQGALVANRLETPPPARQVRRRRARQVKPPTNPNLDEGYSLLLKALGHLDAMARGGNTKKITAISSAIDHIYAAEELLKPYRGGYVE